jgi:hypothetical protein
MSVASSLTLGQQLLLPDEVGHDRDTERRILRIVTTAARRQGWRVKHQWDHRVARGIPPMGEGFPDLVLVRPPQLLFVELKAQGGRVAREQQAWIDDLRNCGIDARIVRPLDLPSLLEELRRP